jgi:hypothetical protein
MWGFSNSLKHYLQEKSYLDSRTMRNWSWTISIVWQEDLPHTKIILFDKTKTFNKFQNQYKVQLNLSKDVQYPGLGVCKICHNHIYPSIQAITSLNLGRVVTIAFTFINDFKIEIKMAVLSWSSMNRRSQTNTDSKNNKWSTLIQFNFTQRMRRNRTGGRGGEILGQSQTDGKNRKKMKARLSNDIFKLQRAIKNYVPGSLHLHLDSNCWNLQLMLLTEEAANNIQNGCRGNKIQL